MLLMTDSRIAIAGRAIDASRVSRIGSSARPGPVLSIRHRRRSNLDLTPPSRGESMKNEANSSCRESSVGRSGCVEDSGCA